MSNPARMVLPTHGLSYRLEALGRCVGDQFQIDFDNAGDHAVTFHTCSANPVDAPRSYTVGPQQSSSGLWPLRMDRSYDVSVYGPGGFFRSFTGRAADDHARLRIQTERACDADADRFVLHVTNGSSQRVTVQVSFNRHSREAWDQALEHGETMSRAWDLRLYRGCYEFVVTVREDRAFEYRLNGWIEIQAAGVRDPLVAV